MKQSIDTDILTEKSTLLSAQNNEVAFGFQAFCSQVIPVFYATFLNLLQVVAFGAIFFPSQIGNTAGMMTQLLIVSNVISQLSFTFMSRFDTAISAVMADNIPFLRIVALGIYSSLQNDPEIEEKILPTTLSAMSISVILNGSLFILVGKLQGGIILDSFPRYVILGMIFGFGVFIASNVISLSTDLSITPDIFQQLDVDDWVISCKISIHIVLSLNDLFRYNRCNCS